MCTEGAGRHTQCREQRADSKGDAGRIASACGHLRYAGSSASMLAGVAVGS